MRNIREYQDFYKVDTDTAFEMARKTFISKNTGNKLEYYLPFIMQSVKFLNSVNSSRQLKLIAAVCFLIKEQGIARFEDIIIGIQEWPEDKASIFNDTEPQLISFLIRI